MIKIRKTLGFFLMSSVAWVVFIAFIISGTDIGTVDNFSHNVMLLSLLFEWLTMVFYIGWQFFSEITPKKEGENNENLEDA